MKFSSGWSQRCVCALSSVRGFSFSRSSSKLLPSECVHSRFSFDTTRGFVYPDLPFHVFCHSCKEYRNLNAFFAITMGLSNPAVCRLNQTWEVSACDTQYKLPPILSLSQLRVSSLFTETSQQVQKVLCGIWKPDGKLKQLILHYKMFQPLGSSVFFSSMCWTEQQLFYRQLVIQGFCGILVILNCDLSDLHADTGYNYSYCFYRTRPGTIGRTDWQLPNWIPPSFPSCHCWSKVSIVYMKTVYSSLKLIHHSPLVLTSLTSSFSQIWHSLMRATRHLSTIWSILRKWWGPEGADYWPFV